MQKIIKLSNGLRVALEHCPSFRTVAFGIWVKVGSINENDKNNGIAHAIEHMLFQGTTTKTSKDIADIIASIGDDVNAFTSKEFTSFYATTLPEYLPKLIELLGDMFVNPSFSKEAFRKEKSIILDEIDMYNDSPDDLVHEMLQNKIWHNHPIGYIISGKKTNVKRFSTEQLRTFKEEYYRAGNMIISIAGSFDEETLVEQLETAFGSLAAECEVSDLSMEEPEYNKCFYVSQKDIEQLHINIAMPSVAAPSEEQYISAIVNSAFGGSNNSVLFQRIREDMGLAYSVFSYESSFMTTGLRHIDITINQSQAERVLREVMGLIETFRLDKDDFEIFKRQVITELIMGNESIKSKMSRNAKSIFFYDEIYPLSYFEDKIYNTSYEYATAFIERYFNTAKCSVALVGNTGACNLQTLKRLWRSLTDKTAI